MEEGQRSPVSPPVTYDTDAHPPHLLAWKLPALPGLLSCSCGLGPWSAWMEKIPSDLMLDNLIPDDVMILDTWDQVSSSLAPSCHHGNLVPSFCPSVVLAVFLQVFVWIRTSAAEDRVEAAASGEVT